MRAITKVFNLSRKPSMAKILALQTELAKLPQIVAEPTHHFAPGMYVRELVLPKDSLVVGKIHRYEHVVMLLKGDATIYTENKVDRIKGPSIWISPAGAKRVVYAHKECTFATVHATNETDLDKIEEWVIVPEALMIGDK